MPRPRSGVRAQEVPSTSLHAGRSDTQFLEDRRYSDEVEGTESAGRGGAPAVSRLRREERVAGWITSDPEDAPSSVLELDAAGGAGKLVSSSSSSRRSSIHHDHEVLSYKNEISPEQDDDEDARTERTPIEQDLVQDGSRAYQQHRKSPFVVVPASVLEMQGAGQHDVEPTTSTSAAIEHQRMAPAATKMKRHRRKASASEKVVAEPSLSSRQHGIVKAKSKKTLPAKPAALFEAQKQRSSSASNVENEIEDGAAAHGSHPTGPHDGKTHHRVSAPFSSSSSSSSGSSSEPTSFSLSSAEGEATKEAAQSRTYYHVDHEDMHQNDYVGEGGQTYLIRMHIPAALSVQTGRQGGAMGPRPLYLLLPSAGDNFWTPLSQEFTYQMAMRGYVAAEVDYNRHWGTYKHANICASARPKAEKIFAGQDSALQRMCALEYVDCGMGIALHGIGQGGHIATFGRDLDNRVSAALFFAVGDGHNADVYPISKWGDVDGDERNCMLSDRNMLTRFHRRYVIGEHDQYAGGTPHRNLASAKRISGYNCGEFVDCLQPDGSGYMIVTPEFYASHCTNAPHYFFQDMYGLYQHHYPVCQFLGYSRWAMHQNLEWLSQRGISDVPMPDDYAMPLYPLQESACVFCPYPEADLFLRQIFRFGLVIFIIVASGILLVCYRARKSYQETLKRKIDFSAELKAYRDRMLGAVKHHLGISDEDRSLLLNDPTLAAEMEQSRQHRTLTFFDSRGDDDEFDVQRALAKLEDKGFHLATQQGKTTKHTEVAAGYSLNFVPPVDDGDQPAIAQFHETALAGSGQVVNGNIVPSDSEVEPTHKGTEMVANQWAEGEAAQPIVEGGTTETDYSAAVAAAEAARWQQEQEEQWRAAAEAQMRLEQEQRAAEEAARLQQEQEQQAAAEAQLRREQEERAAQEQAAAAAAEKAAAEKAAAEKVAAEQAAAEKAAAEKAAAEADAAAKLKREQEERAAQEQAAAAAAAAAAADEAAKLQQEEAKKAEEDNAAAAAEAERKNKEAEEQAAAEKQARREKRRAEKAAKAAAAEEQLRQDEEAADAAKEKAQREAEEAVSEERRSSILEAELAELKAKAAKENAAKLQQEIDALKSQPPASPATPGAGSAAACQTPGSAASASPGSASSVSPPVTPYAESNPNVKATTLQIYDAAGESRSAGLDFTKDWYVKSVDAAGQAAELGIQAGWKMVQFHDTAVVGKFKLKNVKKALVESGATDYVIMWDTAPTVPSQFL